MPLYIPDDPGSVQIASSITKRSGTGYGIMNEEPDVFAESHTNLLTVATQRSCFSAQVSSVSRAVVMACQRDRARSTCIRSSYSSAVHGKRRCLIEATMASHVQNPRLSHFLWTAGGKPSTPIGSASHFRVFDPITGSSASTTSNPAPTTVAASAMTAPIITGKIDHAGQSPMPVTIIQHPAIPAKASNDAAMSGRWSTEAGTRGDIGSCRAFLVRCRCPGGPFDPWYQVKGRLSFQVAGRAIIKLTGGAGAPGTANLIIREVDDTLMKRNRHPVGWTIRSIPGVGAVPVSTRQA